ncbi:endonuclease/exonuclease/phosphatase family protein [Sulfurovum sp. NBC37-1]|uniref:endonuclease/exonuclease/phosphatase family protein n=1 Tax=Sulfurovum sp. (strain NBC37-1) TaxID=387093 RepID=UPI0001587819|nr:endonuclease/exonuclease/phosphatase family protein [Sulfurovum sp. NBC37-1]BAF71673.1 conserved hypothetical protein [Sulfurovum sp. NBC37-1]
MIRFLPSVLHHKACGKQCNSYFPETFTLLCWNVHKKNQTDPAFSTFLKKLLKKKDLYLCMFQEAEFRGDTFTIDDCAYDAAANLQVKDTFYGVLTACRTESNSAKAYLSNSQESLVGPHKSLLLSTYPLRENITLLILNVHAINFRENSSYERELEIFAEKVRTHEGPMIVAGDFNAWNKKRMEALQKLQNELSLERVTFTKEDNVKSFMGYPLDFVLYRGMECTAKEVISDHDISDHHPLLVSFRTMR